MHRRVLLAFATGTMAVAAARKRCRLSSSFPFLVIGVTQSAKGGGLAISIINNRYLVGGVAEVGAGGDESCPNLLFVGIACP
jgi:hypothetical protein